MRKATHLLIGITIGVIIACYTKNLNVYYPVFGGLFGILPDFDVFLNKLGIAKHRGAYSHSLGSSFVISLIFFLLSIFFTSWKIDFIFYLTITVFLATFMHSLLDSLTFGGTILFYPISKKRFGGRIKYDDFIINSLLILLCVVAISSLIVPYLSAMI